MENNTLYFSGNVKIEHVLELKLRLYRYTLQYVTSELILNIVIMFFDRQILEIYIVKFARINVLIKGLCSVKLKPSI
jgi:hypothetical protein